MTAPGPAARAAARFAGGRRVAEVRPHGGGNVHETFLARPEGGPCFLLQRLNTRVFSCPALLMANLAAVAAHLERRLAAEPGAAGGRWEVPSALRTGEGATLWTDAGGSVWRALRFVEAAHACPAVEDAARAAEVGRALGVFHALTADLPAEALADTLPGFHVTPLYLDRFDGALAGARAAASAELRQCLRFVEARRGDVAVLEEARARGRLRPRTIHGDPKVDNVLFDDATGRAVAVVDLDTVKPGLLHYDLGDCLRSACNPLGEEVEDWEAVRFEPDLAAALLRGYFGAAGETLTPDDRDLVYDAVRLIAFELGLRFLTDHLLGDVYFRVRRPGHNLARALVQFRLVESLEAQEAAIRSLAGTP